MTPPSEPSLGATLARVLCGLVLNALVARATVVLLRRVPEQGFGLFRKLDRAVTASIIAASLIVGIITVGGILGVLNNPPAILLLTGSFAGMAELSSRGSHVPSRGATGSFGIQAPPALEGGPWLRIGAAILLLTWIPLACERLALPPVAWDALTYHLRFPQIWFHTGRMTTASTPIGDPSHTYYPLGGEILLYWGILSSGTDLWSALSQVPFALAAACALALLAIRSGAGGTAALLSAICWLGTPGILRQSVEPMLDVVFAMYALTSVLFLIRWLQDGDRSSFYLSASAIGLLVGVKVAGVLFAVCLLPLLFHAIRQKARERSQRVRVRDWIAALAIVAALGGYSYARNAVSGGNPVFPIQLSLGRWVILPGSLPSNYYFGPDAKRLTWGAFFLSARSVLEMGPGFLALVALLPLGFVFAKRPGGRRSPLLAWLAGTGLLFLALGGQGLPFREHRYFFSVVALAWACFAALLGKTQARRVRWLAVALLAIEVPITLAYWGKDLILVGPNASHAAALALIVGLALAAWSWPHLRGLLAAVPRHWPRQARTRALTLAALTAGSILVLGVVADTYEENRFDLWRDYWSSRREWKDRRRPRVDYQEMAASWIYLANRTKPTPVTVAYSGMNIPYPLTGYRLRNTVLFVPRNANDRASWYEWGSPPPDPASHPDSTSWVRNVLRLGVRYLCVYRVSDGEIPPSFPIEARWADHEPDRFHLIWAKERARIYEVAGSSS